MSATLWVDSDKEQGVDLGNPILLLKYFAEMGHAAGDGYDSYAEMFGVPDATMLQDDVAPEWLATVQGQAKAFTAKYGDRLTDEAKWVLSQLADWTSDVG